MEKENPYDQRYSGQELYWGKKPSALCSKVIELAKPGPDFHPNLIDIGCGEGRDAVYYAKNGFNVVGMDLSQVGLDKATKYAEENGVAITVTQGDIIDYRLDKIYDVVFSTGVLQYLPPEVRKQGFQHYKESTSSNGINAFAVFVEKPFIPAAPDAESKAYKYISGELLSYYWDWNIVFYAEEIFPCMSSGVPHKHAICRMIARRYID